MQTESRHATWSALSTTSPAPTFSSRCAIDDVVSSLLGIFLASASPDQTGRLLDLLVAGVAAPDS